MTEMRYEISVWNWRGDVVRKLWRATQADLDELIDTYSEDPKHDVVIDDEWEAEDE